MPRTRAPGGYAFVLQRLVGADPAVWTADVPAVLAALARPELGAFYLAAAATTAPRPPVPSLPARPGPCSPLSPSAAPCPHPPTRMFPTRRSTPAGRGPAC